MRTSGQMLCVARVLHEDPDLLTLEVAKHDGVSFTLQRDADGVTVGGDEFLTLVFVRFEGGTAEAWKPWER